MALRITALEGDMYTMRGFVASGFARTRVCQHSCRMIAVHYPSMEGKREGKKEKKRKGRKQDCKSLK